MPFRLTSTFPLGGALLLAAAAASCSVTPAGANDANLARARDRAAHGASLFAGSCASCHGERGEGKAYAPSIMGAGALPIYPRDATMSPTTTDPAQLQLQSQTRPPGAPSRNPLRNAQDLFDFLGHHQLDGNARALTPDELWSLVNFMLLAHGSQLPNAGVTPESAGQTPI